MLKSSVFNTLILFFLFNITSLSQAIDNPFQGPWKPIPLFIERNESQTYPKETQTPLLFQNLVMKGLLFFQRTISPIDGDRCPMYPSCSSYGIESIKKHGLFLGIIMTTARLTQERGEMKTAPQIFINGAHRFYDPVENNDFWFDFFKIDSNVNHK